MIRIYKTLFRFSLSKIHCHDSNQEEIDSRLSCYMDRFNNVHTIESKPGTGISSGLFDH